VLSHEIVVTTVDADAARLQEVIHVAEGDSSRFGDPVSDCLRLGLYFR